MIAPVRADAEPAEHLALMRDWVHGWAASRAVAPPVADVAGTAWRVEVGLPRQRRRFVFPALGPEVGRLAEALVEPWVYVKVCCTADELRAVLPARWTMDPPSCIMRRDDAPQPVPPLPAGYVLDLVESPGGRNARIHAADGSLAADGRVALVGKRAIIDRIGTDAAHRRRGLGSIVMGALHAWAHEQGVRDHVLAATTDGRALYETLGWRVWSAYASAIVVGDDVPAT